VLESFDRAKDRQAIVNNINRTQDWLKYATPETRGMLLYQIMRHGTPSHLRDVPSVGTSKGAWYDPEIHYLTSL
jgi:hypothetical protein